MASAIQRIIRSLRRQALGGETDRRLLEAFAEHGDEAAFRELVSRHSNFVMGVCQRILGNVPDAEDAFQATFLVLARKAGSLSWQDSIKSWLHSVACRIALKARGQALRRRQKEHEAAATKPTVHMPADSWNELRGILDEELDQLSAKCRAVLVLCYLEGKTRDEAAEELGWSVGSVRGYLERGRELLRGRLVKRGLTLSAALMTGLLVESLIVPAALAATTTQSAVQFVAGSASHALLAKPVLVLAKGALNAMMITKMKTMSLAAMVLLFVGAGAYLGIGSAFAERPAPEPVAEKRNEGPRPQPQPIAIVQENFQEKKERPADKKKTEVAGIVKEIDLKAGTLKMKFAGDGNLGDGDFNLIDKDMKVPTSLGLTLKLSDLTVGVRIHVQLKDKDITSLRADHPAMFMNFANVDADKKVVAVRTEQGTQSYMVADNAKITVNGKNSKLANVPLNQRSNVTLSLDKKSILALSTGSGREEGKEGKGKPREQKTTGLLSKVEGNNLTVTMRGEGGEQSKTFTVDKATKIRLETDLDETIKVKGEGGERQVTRAKIADGKLADLKAGQRVTTTFVGNQVVDLLVLRATKQGKESDGK